MSRVRFVYKNPALSKGFARPASKRFELIEFRIGLAAGGMIRCSLANFEHLQWNKM